VEGNGQKFYHGVAVIKGNLPYSIPQTRVAKKTKWKRAGWEKDELNV